MVISDIGIVRLEQKWLSILLCYTWCALEIQVYVAHRISVIFHGFLILKSPFLSAQHLIFISVNKLKKSVLIDIFSLLVWPKRSNFQIYIFTLLCWLINIFCTGELRFNFRMIMVCSRLKQWTAFSTRMETAIFCSFTRSQNLTENQVSRSQAWVYPFPATRCP